MIIGIVGLLISLLWVTFWADRRRGTVVDEPRIGRERDVF